jgi:low molecular weight protein-tyrosine phosphatase
VHVVFVCSGNICRSPIAEKVFAAELERAGLAEGVRVTSAGTGGWHVGDPADERAAAVLRAAGYPSDHRARQVDADALDADLIVALDDTHRRALTRAGAGRVRLLRSFDPAAPERAEVPDPYYGADAGFDEVLAMIRAAVPGMLDWVRENK